MSTINTNGINVSYPIPGKNNSSQGFRDNFTSIKNNLDTASSEISDLQNKVVLKQALNGSTLNNDMGNTLISNAATLRFRAMGYDLTNNLSGIVPIDLSLGDIQYGTVTGNVTLQFYNWAPAGTQSNVQLLLNVANTDAYITFPDTVITSDNNYGATTLENFSTDGGNLVISVPYGVTQLSYRLSTLDCGNTIYIEPANRPRKSSQLIERTPASNIGEPGDVSGTVCFDSSNLYICTGTYDGATPIWNYITLTPM